MLNVTLCEVCGEIAKEEVNYPTNDIQYDSNCLNCGHTVTRYE